MLTALGALWLGAAIGYFLGHALGYKKGRSDYQAVANSYATMGAYTGPSRADDSEEHF